MTSLFFLLAVLGCGLLYLSHRHQGWLKRPLDPMPARGLGVFLLLLSLALGLLSLSAVTAIFGWMAIVMLAFSLLPFVSLIVKRMRDEPA